MEIKHKLTNEVLLTIEDANLRWANLQDGLTCKGLTCDGLTCDGLNYPRMLYA